jgi:hypothetical protein
LKFLRTNLHGKNPIPKKFQREQRARKEEELEKGREEAGNRREQGKEENILLSKK